MLRTYQKELQKQPTEAEHGNIFVIEGFTDLNFDASIFLNNTLLILYV